MRVGQREPAGPDRLPAPLRRWLATDRATVPVIAGPTGVGKTAVALGMAQACAGEVISMDSCAAHRGFDIGSAKPTAAERQAVPHHLLDVVGPAEDYSMGRFFVDACRLVSEIKGRGRVPLVVGGTMSYANVLLNGLATVPAVGLAGKRAGHALVDRLGLAAAHARLQVRDPAAARRIHPHDRQRLVRAWEVALATGRPLGSWLAAGNRQVDFSPELIALLPADRQAHATALDRRLDAMVAAGFVDEVRAIVAAHGAQVRSLQAVGYRQVLDHVTGACGLDEAVSSAKVATRRFATYQCGWLRRLRPAAHNVAMLAMDRPAPGAVRPGRRR